MKNHNNFIIPAQALEQSSLPSDSPLSLHIGKNTLVVTPEHMTAIQAANTVSVLSDTVTELLCALTDACGSCEDRLDEGKCPYGDFCGPDECPYKDMDGPEVELSASARKQMGIPLDAKLELYPDVGEALVVAADYKYDLTDLPENVRTLFAMLGGCPGRLNELLMDETEVWYV